MPTSAFRKMMHTTTLLAAALLAQAADAAGPQGALLAQLSVPTVSDSASSPRRAATAGRAYAIDGASFYFEGFRVQVVGLSEPGGMRSAHARQRLQQVLDTGEVTLDGRTDPATGLLRADVWVDGRTVVDWLDGVAPSASLSD